MCFSNLLIHPSLAKGTVDTSDDALIPGTATSWEMFDPGKDPHELNNVYNDYNKNLL